MKAFSIKIWENRKRSEKQMLPQLNIIIISLSGIGDLLLFTPALHLLRRGIPWAHITILVKYPAAAQVLIGNPDVDDINVFDPKAHRILENILFYYKERKKGYDVSISTFPALTFLNNFSTWVIGAKMRWTYKPERLSSCAFLQNRAISYQYGHHRIYYNVKLVEEVIEYLRGEASDINTLSSRDYTDETISRYLISQKGIKLFYYITEEERCIAKQFLQKEERLLKQKTCKLKDSQKKSYIIGIHPGSGCDQPFKRWPEEKFASLGSELQKRFGAQIILFGGTEEVSIAEHIASQMSVQPIIVAGKLTIRETAGLIEQCNLFISNDSGLMHLAVALEIPVIGIFGPTDETHTTPVGEKDRIVVLSSLPCKQECRKRYLFDKYCPQQFRCLKELNVNHLLELIEKYM